MTNNERSDQLYKSIRSQVNDYNNCEDEKSDILESDNIDVSNMFICVYNNCYVGLFNRINFSFPTDPLARRSYNAGSIYKGFNSDYIAIKMTHKGFASVDLWSEIGTKVENKEEYISNCYMNKEMSFDNMRLIMYYKGVINSYKIGFATYQELIEVLKFAYEYFELNQNNQMKLIKK